MDKALHLINLFKKLFFSTPETGKPRCRVLFVLKRRFSYSGYSANFSSGLYNSARFSCDMLAAEGFITKLVEVIDNNSIDREITIFNPDVVIIEALWVVPSKFKILHQLHPKVQFVIRVHSEAAFLAQEGIAIEWLSQYPAYPNVFVAVNSLEAFSEMMSFYPDKMLNTERLVYLPTYYPAPQKPLYEKKFSGNVINIACMGAIRQLKNALIQAIAAIRFADDRGWVLRFHINKDVFDVEGNPTFKSIKSLFANTKHELVLHEWMEHPDFLTFLSGVDISMSVSFSETFCIIGADAVAAGVPVVGSAAIRWLDRRSQADMISVNDITRNLGDVLNNKNLIKSNLQRLNKNSQDAKKAWLEFLE